MYHITCMLFEHNGRTQQIGMASNISTSKEWLKRNIEDENIRFYPFNDFTDVEYINAGGYGAVFKAKIRTLDIMVAYKILHSHYEDEMFENFVKEVSNQTRFYIRNIIIIKLFVDAVSSKFIAKST